VFSCLGFFSILETYNETTGIDVFYSIAGFFICAVISFIISALLYQQDNKNINLVMIGIIAGFFLSLLLYRFICFIFNISSTILLVLIIIIIMVVIIMMFCDDNKNEYLASVSIGAYMLIRGLSFIFGGFPSEAEIFTQLSDDN
jgi:hypothetical protein